MSKPKQPRWRGMRTEETQRVEETLRDAFDQVDAYRYNSASIRVRVIDRRFSGKDIPKRDVMVEKYLRKLPERTQADIVNLLTLAPEELEDPDKHLREWLLNVEFEDPSQSTL